MSPAAGFKVKVLGPVVVEHDDRAIPISGSRPKLVLALLAANAGRAVSIEKMIDGLWGEDPPPTARKSVQVHVSALRRALGETGIVTTSSAGYTLQAEVDSTLFESLLVRASQTAEDDPRSAVGLIDQAMALWEGPPYSDFTDEEVLRGEQARLEELHVQGAAQRIRALLQLGAHNEVLGELESLTRDHPYREELRALHMLALYRSGRQVDALRAYQQTRRTLDHDLGLEPSDELRDLEQRILDHDPSLAGPRPVRDVGVVSTLPTTSSDLVGRESEITTVTDLMASTRLVTLTGVGGSGKTRLAIEAARRQIPSFDGGVFFVDLTPATTDDDVPGRMIDGINLSVVGSRKSVEQLATFLTSRRCLVVMDNCEHVLEGVSETVGALLERCSQLVILATSREAISIAGEHVFRVPSLGIDGIDSPAVELFVIRAREADSDFRMTPEDETGVVEICRRLDGIPLAIELAASLTRSMTIGEIKDRLDNRFRLLTGGSRRSAQRQQTLFGAVDWSYSLLTTDEATMLRRLSVFHDGFDLQDVAPVTGFGEPEASELVDSLVTKSLVDVIRADGMIVRRRLLETIRLFAQEKLVAAEEAVETRERHFEHFIGRMRGTSFQANNHWAHLYNRNQRELANIVSAVDWAIDTDRRSEAALTVARVFWLLVGKWLLSTYESLLEDDYQLSSPADQALLLTGRVMAAFDRSDPIAAEAAVESARALCAQGEALDDVLMPQLGAFGYAPVDGAAERLAILDELLPFAERSPTADANIALIEMQRAGQLYSLGRLEQALASATRMTEVSRRGGLVKWDEVMGELVLLVLLGQRSRAQAKLEELPATDDYEFDICRCICEVGAGNASTAAKRLALSARRHASGRLRHQEGDYLCLFAAFRSEIGDDLRADQILRATQPRFAIIQWLVWPFVWKWTEENFVEGNTVARDRELTRLSDPDWDTSEMTTLLAEELEFWEA